MSNSINVFSMSTESGEADMKAIHATKIQCLPYKWDTETEGYLKWTESLKEAINMMPFGSVRETASAVIRNDRGHEPKFKTKKELQKEYKLTSDEQIDAVHAEHVKAVAKEIQNIPAAKLTVHSELIRLLDKPTLLKLKSDKEFHDNMLSAKADPFITWKIMTKKLFVEREGTGTTQKILTVNKLKLKLLQISQGNKEDIMDFHDARRRIADSLAALGTNTIPDVYPDDEAETISFLFGLDRQRYGRWIRDIENGMATMPTTIDEVITMAKLRKELGGDTTDTNDTQPESIFVTNNASQDLIFGMHRKPKFEYYDQRIPLNKWKEASKAERDEVSNNHREILKAADNIRAQRKEATDAYHASKSDKTQKENKHTTCVTFQTDDSGHDFAAIVYADDTDIHRDINYDMTATLKLALNVSTQDDVTIIDLATDNESVLSSDNASMPSLLDMDSDSDSIPDLEDDDTIIDLATDTRMKEAKAVIRRGVRQHKANTISRLYNWRSNITPDRYAHTKKKTRSSRNQQTQSHTTLLTYRANRSPLSPFHPNNIILDNASALHICTHLPISSNIRQGPAGKLSGINEGQTPLTYHQVCTMIDPHFGTAVLIPNAAANILSQALLEENGVTVAYNQKESLYTVRTHTQTYMFGRYHMGTNGGISRHYVMDATTKLPPGKRPATTLLTDTQITTVRHNKTKYNKHDIKRADKALELIKALAYPPLQRMKEIVRTMTNCPITTEDVDRAFDIYNTSLSAHRGRATQHKPRPSIPASPPLPSQQTAQADLFYVCRLTFLLVILSPQQYSFAIPLKDKATSTVHAAISFIIDQATSKGITITWLTSDGEPALQTQAVTHELATHAIQQDTVGSGSHAHKAERRIRYVKEKTRSILYSLPYKLNITLLRWAVQAGNRLTNFPLSSTTTGTQSPRELFLGRQTDYIRDIGAPFGTYVLSHMPSTSNSMASRTEACIFLLPKETTTMGTYYLYKLSTNKIITRQHFSPVPMPDTVVQHLNALAHSDHIDYSDVVDQYDTLVDDDNAAQNEHHDINATQNEQHYVHDTQNASCKDNAEYHRITTKEAEQTENEAEEEDEEAEANMQYDTTRRSNRIKIHQQELVNYWTDDMLANIPEHEQHTLLTIKQAVNQMGNKAEIAVREELRQLMDKGTFQPINIKYLTQDQRQHVIGAKMFIKEKTHPDGTFDKVKARLVARGDLQDRSIYTEDLSAYTVERCSIMIIITIAVKENRHVASLDIGGAYLNAQMPDHNPDIIMRIDPQLATIVCDLDESYNKLLGTKGEIYVKLKRALYGCIESAKLWQQHLIQTLKDMQFAQNRYDPCVLNKYLPDGKQITIAFHVDDLLITSCNQQAINDLCNELKNKYAQVKTHEGKIISYLGMNIDMSTSGTASITADGLIQQIIKDSNVPQLEKPTKSPATSELFEVDDDSPLLPKDRSDYFHTFAARLAYAARMIRHECIATAAFLVTRVSKSTEQDLYKLHTVIRYLHQSHNKGIRGFNITWTSGNKLGVQAYIDASFANNPDRKSQTGSWIGIGGNGPIDIRSNKQSTVTKSTAEAELTALSDISNQAIHANNILKEQGHTDMPPIKLFQDNKSTIILCEKGKSTSIRTKHIDVKYFWLSEKIDNKEMNTYTYQP